MHRRYDAADAATHRPATGTGPRLGFPISGGEIGVLCEVGRGGRADPAHVHRDRPFGPDDLAGRMEFLEALNERVAVDDPHPLLAGEQRH